MRDTLSRAQAAFALEELRGLHELERAATRLKGLPVEIRVQGLCMAIATLVRDDSQASRDILRCIREWLTKRSPVRVLDVRGTDVTALLEAVATATRATYLAAQRDALGLAEQLKVLSDALVKGGEKKEATHRPKRKES